MPRTMTVKLSYTIEESPKTRTTIYNLKGTVDSSKCLEHFYNNIKSSPSSYFILNLKEIDFINSSGFGEFISLNNYIKSLGKEVIFVELNDKVMSVFNVLGGNILLKVVPSEKDALKQISDESKRT